MCSSDLTNLEKETDTRWENAQYLSKRVKDIPGIAPATLYPETTKAVYHLYPLLFDKDKFKGLTRGQFLESLRAEGVPCSSGYVPLHAQPFIKAAFESTLYRKVYDKEDLDYQKFIEKNQCPMNDRICNEESIWLSQSLFLANKSSMDNIANAIEKIQANADKIAKKLKK